MDVHPEVERRAGRTLPGPVDALAAWRPVAATGRIVVRGGS
ncbi:MAG: hypothetical protein ACRD0J_09645 [Acidimicrobiales bacterium]